MESEKVLITETDHDSLEENVSMSERVSSESIEWERVIYTKRRKRSI